MSNEVIGNILMIGISVSVIGSMMGIVLNPSPSFDDTIYTVIVGERHNSTLVFVIQRGYSINDSCCFVSTLNNSYTFYFNYWCLGQFKTIHLEDNSSYYDVKIIEKTTEKTLFTGRFI